MSESTTEVKTRPKVAPIRGWWAWVATLLSGALLNLIHPPIGAGALVFLAFVPWLVALPGFRTRTGAAVASFISGFIGYLLPFAFLGDMVGYEGTESAMAGLWFASAAICATTHLFFGLIGRFAMQRSSRHWWAFWLPLIWMGLEELRYHFPCPSPLMLPGYALHQIDLLIQIAELGSIHLVSGFVVFVAACLAIALDAKLRREKEILAPIIMCAGFALVIGFGMFRMAALEDQIQREGGPQVAVVQPNIPQEIKNQSNHLERYQLHKDLSSEALKEHPDLVIWSETAYPYMIETEPSKQIGPYDSNLGQLAAIWKTPLLSGATTRPSQADLAHYPYLTKQEADKATYNSALFYDAKGQRIGQFDKAHLVPGGEYFPYRGTLIGDLAHSYADALLQGFETTLQPGH
ncbi:MAG: apolipoprotein N-acyltransferase, partial [Planctomycetes bacterium]|nr:apolipoprotein N-acyltransferase [Planctomycetota bacterium]